MKQYFDTVGLLVLDGVGCGEATDCRTTYPEDRGANSLLHAARITPLDAPALQSMGMERIKGCRTLCVRNKTQYEDIRGAFGALEPTFLGKGSPEGHQALMGFEVEEPYLYFDKDGFPSELIEAIEQKVGALLEREVEVIRNPETDDISGTEFINDPRIWQAHYWSKFGNTLKLPVYASSDSVIQIAIHENVLPQQTIEDIGHVVRKDVCDAFGYRVGRVIMRPFGGKPRCFERIPADRRDYAMDPDGPTLIDSLSKTAIPIHAIGKSADMLNRRGFDPKRIEKLGNDQERITAFAEKMHTQKGLIFANLNETDELYGHRREPREYIEHINTLSKAIADIQKYMHGKSLLIITSDHGNDPTHTKRSDDKEQSHTNHTRERVPLLSYHPGMRTGINLGIRKTYTDVAATLAENFRLIWRPKKGKSFLRKLTS